MDSEADEVEIRVTEGTIDRPDLWVEQIRIESETGTEISVVNENQHVAFRISVFNGGAVTADDFELQVFLDDGNDPLFSFGDLSLDAQARTQRLTALWSATAGNHVLRAVVVVPASAVADGNIVNNALEVAFGVNASPTANAGVDQSAVVNGEVFLDGTNSADPDEDALTYLWSQVAGTAVTLSDVTVVAPAFTPTESGAYTFSLVVNDGELDSEADEVEIRVTEGITVSGTVFYSTTPIEGIKVELKDENDDVIMVTFSSSSGAYEFSGIQPGEYLISFDGSATGWGSTSWGTLFTVGSQTITGFDFYVLKNINLISPIDGAVVTTLTPVFEWEPIPEATRYELGVYSTDTEELVEDAGWGCDLPDCVTDLTTPSYEVRSKLELDTQYTWSVGAFDVDGNRVSMMPITCGDCSLPHERTFWTPGDVDVTDGTTVSGTVYYSTTPIEGITVELLPDTPFSPPVMETTSSSSGAYEFSEVLPGEYWVKLSDPNEVYLPVIFRGEQPGQGVIVQSQAVSKELYVFKPLGLISPLDGAVVTTLSPVLEWEPSPEATTYALFIYVYHGEDAGLQSVDAIRDLTTTSYEVGFELEADTEYRWVAGAYDEIGRLVGIFQGIRGDDGLLERRFNFWTPGDGDATDGTTISGTVYYASTPLEGIRVEFRDDNDDVIMETTSSSSGAYEFSEVQPGSYVAKYYGPSEEYHVWFTKGVDVYSQAVIQDLYLSKNIILTSPPFGAVVTTLHPVLEWEPLPEAITYRLQLNVTDTWELVELVRDIENNIYEVTSELEPDTQYTWGVSGHDIDGNQVGYADLSLRFRTPAGD